MTFTSTSTSDLWDAEYEKAGIPSSARDTPSRVVVQFLDDLQARDVRPVTALDIGCGTGRNALYMATCGCRVFAMDYAESQVRLLSNKLKVGNNVAVTVRRHDVSTPWPVEDGWADIAIDTYCFKHQIDNRSIATYIAELHRSLKPGGMAMLFLADRQDGYYRQFPVAEQDGMGVVIRDPGNDILSRLYNTDDIRTMFAGFKIVEHQTKTAENEMHGKIYPRLSHVFYLRKPI